ncbi:hypothetical protein ACFWWM_40630 [Streptomyces sp. NPDC058682]|uniref:hypothetical protein n=1 Tax=Streptomyces TaxID=1883 RepID=UPI0028D37E7A|nr:hypothetical protein [Streptomyces sp. DSM 40907]
MIAAWEEGAGVEQVRRRRVLQEISDRLVLVTVRLAHQRGLFRGWRGDLGVDTTPFPAWHQPHPDWKDLSSVEITAGRHHCGGSSDGVFGHSATLVIAASRQRPAGHLLEGKRVSRHPQLAFGAVLDTPGNPLRPTPGQ